MYIYVETAREGMNNLCTEYLEEAYELMKDFKNEVMIALAWMY